MTIIFIENEIGSGQLVTVAETFKKLTIERKLKPGEGGRFLMSPFKSIVVNECLIGDNSRDVANHADAILDHTPYVPIKLTVRGDDDWS